MEERYTEYQYKLDKSQETPEQWTGEREPIKLPPSSIFTTWDEQVPGNKIKLKK
jgi:hypothetical protein